MSIQKHMNCSLSSSIYSFPCFGVISSNHNTPPVKEHTYKFFILCANTASVRLAVTSANSSSKKPDALQCEGVLVCYLAFSGGVMTSPGFVFARPYV